MNKLKCIIIEDERPAREVLLSFIARVEWLELAGTFEEAMSAMSFLREADVDLVFLDIQIPGMSGLDMLKTMNNPPPVIITTAFSNYAVEAFELDVRDYLKKPISFDRFLKAVNRISARPEQSQVFKLEPPGEQATNFGFFNVNKRMVRVQFDEILYVESMREYIGIHTAKEKVVTKMGIGDMTDLLGPAHLRIHRSFIVNLSKVTAFSAEEVFLDKVTLPIGPNYKAAVEQHFGKYFSLPG